MSQQTVLFEQALPGIPGMSYLPAFITEAEERELMKEIEAGHWTHEFARRRQHFGMDYSRPNSAAAVALPEWIESIARRTVARGFFARMPVQALVKRIPAGAGNWRS